MMAHVDDVIADEEFQIEVLAVGRVPDIGQCFRINKSDNSL